MGYVRDEKSKALKEAPILQMGGPNEDQQPEVTLSVILVNFNTSELTLRCLGHIYSLELPPRTEVWVVDNGSKDDSVAEIREAFPQVFLLCNQQNLGFSRAVNMALKRCSGRFALLLNTDCFPRPGAVMELIGAIESRPWVGIAAGSLLHGNGRPQNSFGRAPTLSTELFPKALLEVLWPSRFPSKRRPPAGPMEVESVVGAFLMVRRKAWEEVGLLDEGYFFFLEETDWCLRMRKANWSVLHVPQAKAVHLQGCSAAAKGAAARIEFYRSRYRFFKLHKGELAAATLKGGLILKSFWNWIFSGFVGALPWTIAPKWRNRHRVDREILVWHLRGCPQGWGLQRGEEFHEQV